MPLFKKKTKIEKPGEDAEKIHTEPDEKTSLQTPSKVKIKRRKKIGFKHKTDKKVENKKPIDEENFPEQDKLDEDITPIKEETKSIINEKIEEKKPFTSKKKKTIIKKDMKDKPVFLEDTGEKLGTVYDTIYDKENNLVGYKIKDDKSEAILSFPLDQFDFNKDGLIFVPSWYNNSLKIIEKLEFKDKISPDLTALLSEDAVSNEELYEIFVKHDDEMVEYIDQAKSLGEMLSNRLKVLEKQRIALKDELMDLTEKRLIKDIDRRQFSEDVMAHRRKVNVLDINIRKCKDLLNRLENTSFGVLGKNNLLNKNIVAVSTDKKIENNMLKKLIDNDTKPKVTQESIQKEPKLDIYKDKYFTLKNQYQQLEEEYQELKLAVDKLINKEEI